MNTTARYITDHAGEPVDGPRLGAIRRTLRGLWGHMPAPAASWAEGTSQHVHLQIYIGLATLCPEVGFCADNWKARVLCTASYPNWIRTRLPKTKTEVKEEAGTSDSNSGKRKRLSEGENMAVEGQDGHHDLPIKRPHLAEQTSVDLMDVDDSTPPMLTPSLDEAEKSAPNEKLPTPKNPLFSGGRRKIVPQQIFSAPEPTSPLPSLQHGSEAPSASVQTPPIGETPPTAGTTDTLANSVPAKNQAVYKPSKTSKSARGLCAVDWMSKTENKAKTAEEFDEFWKGTIMSSAALKKRWDKRSAAAHGSMQEAVASTGVSGQRRSSRKAPAAQEDA
ncbi:hypothetical protein DL96DRAFT_875807 [Flagelloscypha sp. PMI_526]|nr:hypothetical protein DL96DRAFT_875807 [Flagelloscypha sp. PMI_526]